MLLMWLLMLVGVLASESWMVVHVAVSAIQSRILGRLVINLEDVFDPLRVHQLLLHRKLVSLLVWTLLDIIVRIKKVIAGIDLQHLSMEELALLDLDDLPD